MRKKEADLLKSASAELQNENVRLKAEIETLKKKLNGDRVCDIYCELCVHSYPDRYDYISKPIYRCLLECTCNDFKRVECGKDDRAV